MEWLGYIALVLLLLYHFRTEAKLTAKLDETEEKLEKAKQVLRAQGLPTEYL